MVRRRIGMALDAVPRRTRTALDEVRASLHRTCTAFDGIVAPNLHARSARNGFPACIC